MCCSLIGEQPGKFSQWEWKLGYAFLKFVFFFFFKNPPARRVTQHTSMEQSKPRAHSSQNLVASHVYRELSSFLAWRGVTVTDA